MNRPTQIILEESRYCWHNQPATAWRFYETWSASDIKQFWRQEVLDNSEAFDEDWFAILCVKATEALVDYALIAQYWTDAWREQCDSYLLMGYTVADGVLVERNYSLLNDISTKNYSLKAI
jgi:hypothetical protein